MISEVCSGGVWLARCNEVADLRKQKYWFFIFTNDRSRNRCSTYTYFPLSTIKTLLHICNNCKRERLLQYFRRFLLITTILRYTAFQRWRKLMYSVVCNLCLKLLCMQYLLARRSVCWTLLLYHSFSVQVFISPDDYWLRYSEQIRFRLYKFRKW